MFGILFNNKLLRLEAYVGWTKLSYQLTTNQNHPIYLASTEELARKIITQSITTSFIPTHPRHDFNPEELKVVQVDIIIQGISK